MASEKRLIDANKARVVAQRIYSDPVLIHAILNTLDETPAVDAVEVVHGRWKHQYEKGISYKVCSICGCRNGLDLKFNYCPICGAKMDGDGNG